MTMGFLPNPDDIRCFQELIQSITPQLQAAQATYKDFEKTFGTSVRQAASWYANQVRILQPVLEQVAKDYRAVETVAHRRAVPILSRRGWFGIAPYLNAFELMDGTTVFEKKGSVAFDRFVCSRFSTYRYRRLQRVTKGWWGIAYVKKRQPLIRAAIAAYKDRKHSLTISALLPMVEGLAAAYFRKNPDLVVPRPGRHATVLVKDAALLHREVRADHSDLLMAALRKQIYARYSFDAGRAPSALNRHGILHGEIARFGTEKNSLLTILLLDAMCRIALAGPKVP